MDDPKLPAPCQCDVPINHDGSCMKCGRSVIAAAAPIVDDTPNYMALAAAVGPPFTSKPSLPQSREERRGTRATRRLERIETVKRLRGEGMRDGEIAHRLGISHQALYEWLKYNRAAFTGP